MLWMVLGIVSSFFHSTGDFLSKRIMERLDEYTVAFSSSFFSFLSLTPLLIFTGIPKLDGVFWVTILVYGISMPLGLILYMRAIRLSPLSLTIPILSFTPLFLLLTTPIFLGEYPSVLGIVGVLLIVLGTYFLSIRDVSRGLFAPFRALTNEAGVSLMFLTAFMFSIFSNLAKIGIQHSNPLFFTIISNAIQSTVLFPIMVKKSQQALTNLKVDYRVLLLVGIFNALQSLLVSISFELGLVSYVVSIKRTTVFFSILYGALFFKEKRIAERLSGSIIMVLGILIISFLG